MPKLFDKYKAILFPNDKSRQDLVIAVRTKGFLPKNFDEAFALLIYKMEEPDLQRILAPFLRALAIRHLEYGDTEYTRGFRDQYNAAFQGLDTREPGDAGNLEAFLRQQSRASIYATDLEAGALAEILGLTFASTRVNSQYHAFEKPLIYRKDPSENALVVHLYNTPGDHFFIHEGHYGSTIGDGNCLYNGFAQFLRHFILNEEKENISVYQAQQLIYEKIKSLEPMPLADLIARVRANYSSDDGDDHAAAIRLTKEETVKTNKTISVYFSGTGDSINDQRFLTSLLWSNTEESESQIKLGFSGCGVEYGFNGNLFGTGIDEQCKTAIVQILQEINAGHQVTLNVYGYSRGGIAALMLAKQLANIDQGKLEINLALLDPVPGNFITTASNDPFKISLANKTMDLSDCKPLKKVLALYPHKPLPAIACHAPLLVTYPKTTEVDEEIVNGGHVEVEKLSEEASKLVQLRVEEFLVNNGTKLYTETDYKNAEEMKKIYLERYQQGLSAVKENSTRPTHSAQGMMITAKSDGKYLNDRHKKLAGGDPQEQVSLSIQPETGPFVAAKQFFRNHPIVGQAIKWSLITLAVTGLLFGVAALAPMPFIIPIMVGAFATLGLATLWYEAIKPFLSLHADKFFYPHYAMHCIDTPKVETEYSPDSPRKIMDGLGQKITQVNTSEVESAPQHSQSPLQTVRSVVPEPQPVSEERNVSLIPA